MATKKRTYKRRHRKKKLPSRRRPSNSLILAGILGVLFLLLVVGLIWQVSNGETTADIAAPEVLAQGEIVYQENCVACHGENGKGYIGPALNGSAHAWHHPDPLLVSFIRDGIPDTQMVGLGDKLSDEEIDAVISYFKSWWTPQQRRMQQQGQR